MFTLALLALMQMILLPGLLVTWRHRFDTIASRCIAVFVVSLLCNVLLVELLVSIHNYRQSTMLVVILAEIVGLAYLWKKKPLQNESPRPQPLSVAMVIGNTCALLFVAMHLWLWGQEFGRVFFCHDAIASWNRWALDWSENHWPTRTWNYPQLLPGNWSLVYLISKSREAEPFVRWVMGSFQALILLCFWDLQQRWRQPWLAVSSGVMTLLLMLGFHEQRFDGMADVPVAAVSFTGLYFLLIAKDSAQPFGWLALAAASLAAAGQTKQAGLMIMALALVWMLLDKTMRDTVKRAGQPAWWLLVAMVLIAVHSYAARIFIHDEADTKLVAYLTQDLHEGRNAWQRIQHGFSSYTHFVLGSPFLSFMLATLILAGCFHKLGRRLLLHFAIPYFTLWLLAYSYDVRNSACALPSAALVSGFGADVWYEQTKKIIARLRGLSLFDKPSRLILGGLCAALLLSLTIPSALLSESYKEACRNAGDATFNRLAAKVTRDGGDILTANLHLTIQPALKRRTTVTTSSALLHAPDFQERLKHYRWLALETALPEAESSILNSFITNKTLQPVGHTESWTLYEVSLTK